MRFSLFKKELKKCFSGGMFALAGQNAQIENSDRWLQLGKDITNTCHESYARTATKLGPEAFWFNDKKEEATANAESEESSMMERQQKIILIFLSFN